MKQSTRKMIAASSGIRECGTRHNRWDDGERARPCLKAAARRAKLMMRREAGTLITLTIGGDDPTWSESSSS